MPSRVASCSFARELNPMQFFAFHLMPWDRLPADFDEKYETAWTWLPNSLYDPKHGVDQSDLAASPVRGSLPNST